jgi:hypothetical protein
MESHKSGIFWSLYLRAVAALALVIAADGLWARFAGYNLDFGGIVERAHTAFLFGVLFAAIYLPCKILEKLGIFDDLLDTLKIREFAHFFAVCGLASLIVAWTLVFQYLCVSNSIGVIDDWLFLADRSIGFEWIDAYNWVNRHDRIKQILSLAYNSHWQFLVCFLILIFARMYRELFELINLFVTSAIVVSLISIIVPATSLFILYGTKESAYVSDFYPLRNGHMTQIDMHLMQGLISFPSFHAFNAVIIPYALRNLAYVFPFSVVLNALVLISTPTEGGHYLVDVIFGAGLALLFIRVSRSRTLLAGRWPVYEDFSASAGGRAGQGQGQ